MADSELGKIRGQMILDVSSAVQAYTEVRQKHLSTVSALGAAEGVFRQVGQGILSAAETMAGGILTAVNAASEFERKLDFFTAVSDSTQDEYEAIRVKALELGADTVYSADQIAESFIELGKSGVKAKDIIDGIGEGVAALGAAADIPLDTAANIITAAVQTFQLGADKSVDVANKLAGAANASVVDVQDLGVSLKYAGGVASSLGVSFDETNTALALLGKYGIRGSTAGTALRQTLLSLNGGTKKANNALRELGIISEDGTNAFYDQNGSAKDLAEVFQILQDATVGYSDEARTSILKSIFATRALPTVNALLREGADGFAAMTAEVEKTTAFEVAGERLDNLSGDIEYLRGEFETLTVRMGDTLQGAARGLVQGLEALVAIINTLSDDTLQIIAVIAIIVTIVTALTGFLVLAAAGFLAVYQAVIVLIDILPKLLILIRAVTGHLVRMFAIMMAHPLTLIIAAVAALVGALIWFFTQTEVGQDTWGQLMAIFTEGFESVLPLFEELGSALGELGNTVVPLLAELGGILAELLYNALVAVVPLMVFLAEAITNTLVVALNIVIPIITWLVDALTGPFGAALGIAAGVIAGIVLAVKLWAAAQWLLNTAILANPLGAIIAVIVALVAAIIWVATETTFFQDVWAAVSQFFIDTWTNIVNFFTTIWTNVSNFFMDIWNGIVAFLSPIFAAIGAVIQFYIDMWINIFLILAAVLVTIWNAIVAVVTTVWNAIVAFLTPIIQTISDIITTAVTFVQGIWESVWGAISSFFTDIWNALMRFLAPIIVRVTTIIVGAVRGIQDTWNNIWNAIVNFFKDTWNNIVNSVKKPVDDTINTVTTIKDRIFSFFSGVGEWLWGMGEDLIGGLIGGIKDMVGGVINAISDVVNGAINWAKDTLGIHSPSRVFDDIGTNTILGLINGVEGQRRALRGQMDTMADEMTQFYDQVGAAADLEASINAASQLGSNRTADSMASQLALLSDRLEEIAARDTVNIEKLEVNNPEPEPASDSLPTSIRKASYVAG